MKNNKTSAVASFVTFALMTILAFLANKFFNAQLAITVELIGAVLAILFYYLGRKRKVLMLVFNTVLCLGLVAVNLVALKSYQTVKAADSESAAYTMKIVAKTGSGIEKGDSLLGYKVGYVGDDEYYVNWGFGLLKGAKTTGVDYVSYNSYKTLYDALQNGKVDMMFLSGEAEKEFSISDYKIIYEDKQEVELKTLKPVDITNEGFVVLLNGIDLSGVDITKNARADINILLIVDPKTYNVTIQTIPRDLYAAMPCYKNIKTKLNRATELGGVSCQIKAIEQYFGNKFKINYYFRLNFQGFRDFFDALEVPVTVESNYNFSIEGWSFKKGKNVITDGDQALDFCRERKSLPQNDVSRGYHQMNMMKAIINKFLENPSLERVYKILNAIEGNMDTNFTAKEFGQLYHLLINMKGKMKVTTASMSGSNKYLNKKDPIFKERFYYFVPKKGQQAATLNRIINGINSQTISNKSTTMTSIVASGKYAKITWQKTEGVVGYEIFRSAKKDSGYKSIATIKKGTTVSYTDKKVKANVTYYYQIRPIVKFGTKYKIVTAGKYSEPQSFCLFKGTPKISSVKNDVVTWKKLSGASGYEVYRSTSKKGTYTLVDTVKTTKFTDPETKYGFTYYYKIRAYREVNGIKSYSSYSSVKSFKKALATPAIYKASFNKTTHELAITVKKSTNAGVSYDVQVSNNKKKGFVSVNVENLKAVYEITKKGTYYVKVRTFIEQDGKNVYSAFSKLKTVKVKKI